MTNKKQKEEALKKLADFKKRAEKLRKKSRNWEVNPNVNKIMKKMGIPLEISGSKKLTKKRKDKLIRSIKYKLTILKNHFDSVYKTVKKNPMIWDKKIENNERKLGKKISFYERIAPILFRDKTKKKK